MSLQSTRALNVILYEGPESQPLTSDQKKAISKETLSNGFSVQRVSDPQSIPTHDRNQTLLIGNFDGADRADLFSGIDNIQIRDISNESAETIGEISKSLQGESNLFDHKAWKPWFPVIDYDRCTNCMQCLSFCLFGVYGVSSQQQIQVQNQDNCKTNCPACSRVCPEAAIMFPKYKTGPINGDTVSDEDMQREKMKVDISSLLGGDIYDMLRERSERAKSRFSKERDSSKALNERQKCLVKLQKDADIPPEVIMSLPSPDEIQKRAAEASAKAEAARQAIAEKENSQD